MRFSGVRQYIMTMNIKNVQMPCIYFVPQSQKNLGDTMTAANDEVAKFESHKISFSFLP